MIKVVFRLKMHENKRLKSFSFRLKYPNTCLTVALIMHEGIQTLPPDVFQL